MDGDINLGDLSGFPTPFLLAGTMEAGVLTVGALDLGDLTANLPAPIDLVPADLSGDEAPFLLEGSLEGPLWLGCGFAVDALGDAGGIADAGLRLPAFATTDGGTADGMALALFNLSAVGEAGSYIIGRIALAPFDAVGALDGPLTLSSFDLAASGAAGQVLAAQQLLLPFPSVAASAGVFGADAVLAPFLLDARLASGSVAAAALAPSGWTLSASSFQDGSAFGATTFGLIQVDASGSASAVIGASVVLNPVDVAASGTAGNLASALLTVPLFEAGADLHGEAIGSATVLLPAFRTTGAATVTLGRPLTTSIALNTRLKGVSRYEGLAANSFANFAGLQLAATHEGIVALMGETDLGLPISASITAGTSDLGAPNRKRIEAAYVGYRSGNDMELTLITDEHHEYTYRLAPRQWAESLHGTRVKFGRGVDGRYWSWKLANVAGSGFDLASLQLNVNPLSRV